MSIFGTGTIWKWILAHVVPFLLPEAESSDAGKVVSVNSEGEYTLTTPETFNGGTVIDTTRFEGVVYFDEDAQFNDTVYCADGLYDSRFDYTPPMQTNEYVTKQYVDDVNEAAKAFVIAIELPVGSANDVASLSELDLAEINKHKGRYFTAALGTDINNTRIPIEAHFDATTASLVPLCGAVLTESTPTEYVDLTCAITANGTVTSMTFTYKENLSQPLMVYITRHDGMETVASINT